MVPRPWTRMGHLSFQERLESEWGRLELAPFRCDITMSFRWYYHWSRTYRDPVQRARRCAERIAGDIERRRFIIQYGEVAIAPCQFFAIALGQAPWVDMTFQEGIHDLSTASSTH